jgi:hypothetical protein
MLFTGVGSDVGSGEGKMVGKNVGLEVGGIDGFGVGRTCGKHNIQFEVTISLAQRIRITRVTTKLSKLLKHFQWR